RITTFVAAVPKSSPMTRSISPRLDCGAGVGCVLDTASDRVEGISSRGFALAGGTGLSMEGAGSPGGAGRRTSSRDRLGPAMSARSPRLADALPARRSDPGSSAPNCRLSQRQTRHLPTLTRPSLHLDQAHADLILSLGQLPTVADPPPFLLD